MPWGLKRFYGAGDLHFITGSCYHRQAFLGSAKRRDLFLAALERIRERYSFVVIGYVVMPERFHLLLSEPEKGNPSVVMQALKLSFTRRLLPRTRSNDLQADLWDKATPAHIWQRRFYDFQRLEPESRDKFAGPRCSAPLRDRQRCRAEAGTRALGFLPRVRHGLDEATLQRLDSGIHFADGRLPVVGMVLSEVITDAPQVHRGDWRPADAHL